MSSEQERGKMEERQCHGWLLQLHGSGAVQHPAVDQLSGGRGWQGVQCLFHHCSAESDLI